MRLVSSVILSPKPPVNVGKNGLVFVIYCAKDTAAYFWSLLALNTHDSEKGALYAFSTNLAKRHGIFDIRTVKGHKAAGALNSSFKPLFKVTTKL